jgi:hypothetical protein
MRNVVLYINEYPEKDASRVYVKYITRVYSYYFFSPSVPFRAGAAPQRSYDPVRYYLRSVSGCLRHIFAAACAQLGSPRPQSQAPDLEPLYLHPLLSERVPLLECCCKSSPAYWVAAHSGSTKRGAKCDVGLSGPCRV